MSLASLMVMMCSAMSKLRWSTAPCWKNPCLTVQYGGILVGEAVSGHFPTPTGVGKCCGAYFDQDSCHQVYFKLTMQRSGAGDRQLRVV